MVKDLTTTFSSLKRQGFPLVKILTFLLDVTGSSKSLIARKVRVTPAFVTMVLAGKRDSAKVKNAIKGALGFDPWA